MSRSAVPSILRKVRDVVTAAVGTADPLRQVVLFAQEETEQQGQRVYVGWSGDPGDQTAARFTQAWVGIGAKRKNEPVLIPCAVVVWDGDSDPAATDARLDTAFDLFGLVEDTLRADPGLGRAGPFVAEIVEGTVLPDITTGGLRLPFTVNIRFSRI